MGVWEEVSPADPFSQGDLFQGIEFPRPDFPIGDIPTERTTDDRGRALTRWVLRPAILVTQCCEIDKDQNKFLALAPITPTGKLSDIDQAAILRGEPELDDSSGYVFDVLHIEPIDELVAPANTLLAADFKQITAFPKVDALKDRRVAKMSVTSRRLLRIKLGLFFGRTSAEDEAELTALGVPVGLTMHQP